VQLAQVLKGRNIEVLIADGDWRRLKEARLADIPIYYGELLSEDAEFSLEHHAYDALLAATGNPAYNALVCNQFSEALGRARTYTLHPDEEGMPYRRRLSRVLKGREWAPDRLTLEKLEALFGQGWRFRISRIGKTPEGNEIMAPAESETLMVLGMITRGGQLRLFSKKDKLALKSEGAYVLFMEKVENP
jgi:hypothetical protein